MLAGSGVSPRHDEPVPGTFIRAGGPAPGSPVPLPGTITARAATGEPWQTALPNGRLG